MTFPSEVEDVSGALGRGGYEGIQNDPDGNLWIVEDIGGPNKQGTTARPPNSFVYRYVPRRPSDLHSGKVQVLQVLNDAGQPVTFESQAALCAPDQVALRTFGKSFDHQVGDDPRHGGPGQRAVQCQRGGQSRLRCFPVSGGASVADATRTRFGAPSGVALATSSNRKRSAFAHVI